MYAWKETVLRVNLTNGNIIRESLDPRSAALYIGGRGLGTKYFYDEVDPKVDPLSPDNKLIFAPGPLTGTYAPSSGRFDIITKAPLSEAIDASNSGGHFGPELKYAGYGMVIIEGKAKKPVYLWINDEEIELRDAGHIWGKTVPDTTDTVRGETNDEAKVACIGPAGENKVLFAAIMNEMNRAAGRGGVGAVMGSKNLKAVAVIGTGGVSVADPDAFRGAVMKARRQIQAHSVGGNSLKAYGTEVLVNLLNEIGAFPTRNFRDAYYPTADKVGGESLSKYNLVRPKGCFSCIVSCGRVTQVTDPKYKGFGEGPEYESAWSLGPDQDIDNRDAIIKANFLCNELGMDTITLGSTIACAMDLYEDGVITTKDTDGVPLNFGNPDVMLELVRKTAFREGFGDKLALGSYRLAESYGHPEYSMSVKKQELPAYDPRAIQGIGLNYATSNRGGCHVRGYTISPEVLGVPEKVDQHATEGKPALVKTLQDLTGAIDSCGACLFSTFGLGVENYAEEMTAATGVEYSPADFMRAGERIWNLERLWNLNAGFTMKDDTLPERLLKVPIKSGPSKGYVSQLKKMLPEYYKLRGWDESGVPTTEKLQELSLA